MACHERRNVRFGARIPFELAFEAGFENSLKIHEVAVTTHWGFEDKKSEGKGSRDARLQKLRFFPMSDHACDFADATIRARTHMGNT